MPDVTMSKPWVGYDVMGDFARHEVKVHEHGLVALVDVMPRLAPMGATADFAVVQAARVSYGQGTKQVSEDRDLIRYLFRMDHGSPFEMVVVKTHWVLPIFVARQIVRHRLASLNEYSARYSEVQDRFFLPSVEEVRAQSASNKQSSEGQAGGAGWFCDQLEHASTVAYEDYKLALEKGVGREQARLLLPLNVMTEWYWLANLRSLFNFFGLRLDAHAQKETRDYAEALYALVKPIVPLCCEAFEDYQLNAMTLSAQEVEALRTGESLKSANKRENAEWEEKRKKLGTLNANSASG